MFLFQKQCGAYSIHYQKTSDTSMEKKKKSNVILQNAIVTGFKQPL